MAGPEGVAIQSGRGARMSKRCNQATHTFTKADTPNLDAPALIVVDLDHTEETLLHLWKPVGA